MKKIVAVLLMMVVVMCVGTTTVQAADTTEDTSKVSADKVLKKAVKYINKTTSLSFMYERSIKVGTQGKSNKMLGVEICDNTGKSLLSGVYTEYSAYGGFAFEEPAVYRMGEENYEYLFEGQWYFVDVDNEARVHAMGLKEIKDILGNIKKPSIKENKKAGTYTIKGKPNKSASWTNVAITVNKKTGKITGMELTFNKTGLPGYEDYEVDWKVKLSGFSYGDSVITF